MACFVWAVRPYRASPVGPTLPAEGVMKMDDQALAAASEWLAREWEIPPEEAREYVGRWSSEEDAGDLVAFFFLHCDYPWYGEHPPYEAELAAVARCG